MAIIRRNSLLLSSSPSVISRLQALLSEQQQQRWTQTSTGESGAHQLQDTSSFLPLREGAYDSSTWRTVNSRIFGFKSSHISQSTWTVLNILQMRGFKAYLVGGCVRDLILGKTPKDFDVVTTATLAEIKKQFRRCLVVGRRFPICQVYVRGCKVEVSSFETVHIDAQHRQTILFSEMPKYCDKKHFVLWKDSMRRDFTINGLFYDPFVSSIYDYVDGIRDAMASEVRTVIPAHLSFKEDCARILRGLRIVARLGLRFSKDTDIAVQDLASTIVTLGKARLMMELNFMLAYGAAVPSICLLQKYKLLDILLPIQAAYLTYQAKKQSGESSILLMKLFSHVDKLLAVDRPSDCRLWLGLLAFHLALVNHPQNALVVWTFASVLYFGTWNRGIKYVRESVRRHVRFAPEILELSGTKSDDLLQDETESDDLLLEKTSHLASLIKSSVDAFISPEALEESLVKYQMMLPCSESGHQIFVSERAGKNVAKLFDPLEVDLKSYFNDRETSDVDYERLKKGDPDEIRFMLGKIIFDTLNTELACQVNEKTSMRTSSDELISQQDQNAITTNDGQLLTSSCPESAVNTIEGKLIYQQAHVAGSVKKGLRPLPPCPKNEIDAGEDELVLTENRNAIMMMKGRLPPSTGLEKYEDESKGEPICQQHQNSIAMEKRETHLPACPNNTVGATKEVELNRRQDQNATAMAARLLPLADCPGTAADMKDELIHQKKRMVKKRQLSPAACPENAANASKGKIIRQQNQSATAVKEKHVRLSSLFE